MLYFSLYYRNFEFVSEYKYFSIRFLVDSVAW